VCCLWGYDTITFKMKTINKTLLKRLELMSNKELLVLAQSYKIENRVNNTSTFQRNYNTILFELEKRKLLNIRRTKNGKMSKM